MRLKMKFKKLKGKRKKCFLQNLSQQSKPAAHCLKRKKGFYVS